MLQGVKAVISQLGGVRMTEHAKDTAVMFGIILHRARGEYATEENSFKQASSPSVLKLRSAALRAYVEKHALCLVLVLVLHIPVNRGRGRTWYAFVLCAKPLTHIKAGNPALVIFV